MKNKLHITFILAALTVFLTFIDSVHSQNVNSSINTGTKTIINALKIESSSTIELNNTESWLSKKSYLDMNSSRLSVFDLYAINETVIENNKDIEEWMLDNNAWEIIASSSSENYIEDKTELEDWMVDPKFWQIKESKACCPIEDWMTDKNFWVLVK